MTLESEVTKMLRAYESTIPNARGTTVRVFSRSGIACTLGMVGADLKRAMEARGWQLIEHTPGGNERWRIRRGDDA